MDLRNEFHILQCKRVLGRTRYLLHSSLGMGYQVHLLQIMKKLGALPGDMITIRNININKATFVKLRFRDPTFNDLSNPRAM